MSNFNKIKLSEKPELLKEVISLIEKSFNYSAQNSYYTDFFPLLNESNHHNCHLLIDQNENLVGHVGIRQIHLNINNNLFPLSFLGGIAIQEEHQGKGLLTELLNTVIDEYANQTTFFILWSNLSGLYEKFSFYEVGNVIQQGNTDTTKNEYPVGFDPISWKDLNQNDMSELSALYQLNKNHFLIPERSLDDWNILKNITSSQLLIKRDEAGSIEEYIIANKGADLCGIIHEFGTRSDLETFKAKVFPYKVWYPSLTPKDGKDLSNFFNFFIKIGVRHLVRFFFKELSQNQLDVLNIQGDQVIISLNKQQYGLTQESFLKAFFGPTIIDEFRAFSKPLYISGLDSI